MKNLTTELKPPKKGRSQALFSERKKQFVPDTAKHREDFECLLDDAVLGIPKAK